MQRQPMARHNRHHQGIDATDLLLAKSSDTSTDTSNSAAEMNSSGQGHDDAPTSAETDGLRGTAERADCRRFLEYVSKGNNSGIVDILKYFLAELCLHRTYTKPQAWSSKYDEDNADANSEVFGDNESGGRANIDSPGHSSEGSGSRDS